MIRKFYRNSSRAKQFSTRHSKPTRKVKARQVNINETPEWQKSSYCGSNACVEVKMTSDAVLVRDSKNPEGAPLAFNMDEWSAFVQGVRAGEFS